MKNKKIKKQTWSSHVSFHCLFCYHWLLVVVVVVVFVFADSHSHFLKQEQVKAEQTDWQSSHHLLQLFATKTPNHEMPNLQARSINQKIAVVADHSHCCYHWACCCSCWVLELKAKVGCDKSFRQHSIPPSQAQLFCGCEMWLIFDLWLLVESQQWHLSKVAHYCKLHRECLLKMTTLWLAWGMIVVPTSFEQIEYDQCKISNLWIMCQRSVFYVCLLFHCHHFPEQLSR